MTQHDNDDHAHLTAGGWLALAVLLAFLAVSLWYAIYAWGAIGDAHLSSFGWFALIAGSLITVGIGGGLMALLFYSNDHDLDR